MFACIGSQTHTTGCSPCRGRVQQRRQQFLDPPGAHPRDQRQPARACGPGSSASHSAVTSAARRRRAELDADRVVHARRRTRRGLRRAARVRSPIQSMCAEQSYQSPVSESRRVRPARSRAAAPRGSSTRPPRAGLRSAARSMPHAAMNRSARSISVGDRLVAPPLGRGRDELLVPQVHLGQVGEAALGERPQQVQRRGRLVVALHHPVRVEDARLRRSARRRAPCGRGSVGSSTPSTISVGDERGFTNCPAIRPSLTTGSIEP